MDEESTERSGPKSKLMRILLKGLILYLEERDNTMNSVMSKEMMRMKNIPSKNPVQPIVGMIQ